LNLDGCEQFRVLQVQRFVVSRKELHAVVTPKYKATFAVQLRLK